MSRNSFFGSNELFDTSLLKESELFRTDIYEVENNYEIVTDLPGFLKDNIQINYNNGYITITAKKEQDLKNAGNYLHRERFYGEYKRTFYVGNIKEDNIRAKYQDGILKITLEKQAENKDNKKIDIE